MPNPNVILVATTAMHNKGPTSILQTALYNKITQHTHTHTVNHICSWAYVVESSQPENQLWAVQMGMRMEAEEENETKKMVPARGIKKKVYLRFSRDTINLVVGAIALKIFTITTCTSFSSVSRLLKVFFVLLHYG